MIDLTGLKCSGADVTMMDWGANLDPVLGGVSQRISRLGTRFAIDFTTPLMRVEADGRKAITLLQQAKRDVARVEYPQAGFKVGSPGSPVVSGAHTGGTSLTITGATPNYAIKIGQALNITVADRAYLYFAAEAVALNGSGAGVVTLTTPMRTHLAGGEAVTLNKPVVEGFIDGDSFAWTIQLAQTVGLQFRVTERA